MLQANAIGRPKAISAAQCSVRAPLHCTRATRHVRSPQQSRSAQQIRAYGRPHQGTVRRHNRLAIAQAALDTDKAHVQLATAKLPKNIQLERFRSEMFQWANTLTSTSGRQMPFSLPLRITPNSTGFEISLLRSQNGVFVSEGNIVTSIEEESNVGPVLFIRFYEGELKPRKDLEEKQRLKTTMARLIDLPIIINSFPAAIREISKRCTS